MCTYSNRLQPALQNLLQRVVRFFHPRSSCTTRYFRYQEYSFSRLFVPWNIHSHDGTLVLRTIRSLELSFPGPFVPWNIRSLDRSFPGTVVPGTVGSRITRLLFS